MSKRLKRHSWTRTAQERSRDWVLRQKGSSLEDFEVRIQKQGKRCLICMREMRVTGLRTGAQNRAVLDHDHVTGKIRGIICSRCNLVMGLMGDDVDLLISAVVYLKSFE